MYFVFDIDGTTSYDGISIDPKICAAFRALHDAGHTAVLASARPIRDMLPMLPADLKHIPCIGANGALVYMDGATQVRAIIDPQAFNAVRKLIKEYGVDYVADSSRHYAFSLPAGHFLIDRIDADQRDTRVELEKMKRCTKIMMLNITSEKLHDTLLEAVQSLKVEVAEHDDPTGANIDLTAAGVNKQAALTEVLSGAPYIAFGNDTNDIEMLKNAELAVCVGPKKNIQALAHRKVPAQAEAVAAVIYELITELKTGKLTAHQNATAQSAGQETEAA